MAFKPLESIIQEYNALENGIFPSPSPESFRGYPIKENAFALTADFVPAPKAEKVLAAALSPVQAVPAIERTQKGSILTKGSGGYPPPGLEKAGSGAFVLEVAEEGNSNAKAVVPATAESLPKGAGPGKEKGHAKAEEEEPAGKPKKKISVISIASNLLFYIVITGAVLLALVGSGKGKGGPRDILGYSYFTVLTGSMQKEIPIGSLVITRRTDPAELQIGDNITYMKNASTTVTHKIVGVHENYDGNGARGFQTQGVNNPQPDRDIVDAANVVGKVVFSAPRVGQALTVLSENIVFVMIFLGLLLLLSYSLQIFFKIRKEEKAEHQRA